MPAKMALKARNNFLPSAHSTLIIRHVRINSNIAFMYLESHFWFIVVECCCVNWSAYKSRVGFMLCNMYFGCTAWWQRDAVPVMSTSQVVMATTLKTSCFHGWKRQKLTEKVDLKHPTNVASHNGYIYFFFLFINVQIPNLEYFALAGIAVFEPWTWMAL